MKNLLLIIVVVFIGCHSNKEYNSEEIVSPNGDFFYVKKTMKLVTGKVNSYYQDSIIRYQVIYKNGVPKYFKEYLSDGQLVYEGFYKNGEKINSQCWSSTGKVLDCEKEDRIKKSKEDERERRKKEILNKEYVIDCLTSDGGSWTYTDTSNHTFKINFSYSTEIGFTTFKTSTGDTITKFNFTYESDNPSFYKKRGGEKVGGDVLLFLDRYDDGYNTFHLRFLNVPWKRMFFQLKDCNTMYRKRTYDYDKDRYVPFYDWGHKFIKIN
tara:strand:+ start:199 stop:999 length:801 start_codon:yes stop_codon:yes gene_type:complete